MNDKILKRTKSRKIGGVANGIAVYLNIDPVIVRALFLFSICFGGV
ncbi:MAG: PspC domain-containing protein, partial [Bacteroidales bacterium]|nr:PspC domain-containing protein [Bacteroidales bacterium]